MLPPQGINVSGPIIVSGGGLYVPTIATLAKNNVALNNGGVIATNGNVAISYGPGSGQISISGPSFDGTGGGFAAVGGPLTIHANNDQPINFRPDGGNYYGPTGELCPSAAPSSQPTVSITPSPISLAAVTLAVALRVRCPTSSAGRSLAVPPRTGCP